jgi:hypothetical protein
MDLIIIIIFTLRILIYSILYPCKCIYFTFSHVNYYLILLLLLLLLLTFSVRSAPIGAAMSKVVVAKVPRFVYAGI